MAKKKPIQRGPKGGKKHTPGRDHDAKSRVKKNRKRKRKAEQRRADHAARLAEQWKVWENLNPDQKKMLPELKPESPRSADAPQE